MDKPSEASAFIAVLLTFFGLSDLTAASLDALPALEYWLSNVPVRLTVLFAVTAYSYLFSEGGYLGPTLGVGRYLCNSWVFGFAFLELMMWYWVSCCSNVGCGYRDADLVDCRFSSRSGKRGGSSLIRSWLPGRQRRDRTLCKMSVGANKATREAEEHEVSKTLHGMRRRVAT
jgi:hypothetical protein